MAKTLIDKKIIRSTHLTLYGATGVFISYNLMVHQAVGDHMTEAHGRHKDVSAVCHHFHLYKRALKLEFLSKCYEGKWWLLPGAFHISLCAIRCLGKTIAHSGLDEAGVASGLHSQVTGNESNH